jgi:hypothetical protein
MANIVTTTKLSENVNEVVYSFQLQYVDTGDESAVTKVDVSTLETNSNGDACTGVKILECTWVIKGMTVQVLADASTDVMLLHLSEDQSGYVDYRAIGGLPNTKSLGTSPTGDLKFTTTGLGAAGDMYQIVMRLKKKY